MFGLNNIPQVTKNLLLLNILMFVLTFVFQQQGVDLGTLLGAHYVNSPLFRPYQIVSYFFMHADVFHIFFNMFALVMFGGFLERLWGPKRYFILYVSAAIGAFALYNAIGVYEIMECRKALPAELVSAVDGIMSSGSSRIGILNSINEYLNLHPGLDFEMSTLSTYFEKTTTPMVGASGSIFGIMAAFAILFPNTELQLMFIPVPIKAKFLIGGYFVYEVYSSIYQSQGDNVAHLAHVGGAVVGAALVLLWRRKDKTNFY